VPIVFDPASYEQISDGALMRIAMDRAELTPEAGAALEAQLSARGLGAAQQREFASTYRAEVAAEEREQVSKGVRSFQSRRGIGTAFYGRRDLKEMNNREQYQATRWFCIFWIPLIPLGTYIVHRTTTTWLGLFDDVRALRKVPLDWGQVFKTWAVAALVLAGIYFLGPWLLFWWVKR
jgi:hypothetical protein